MTYRYIATSVPGFVQQLAVSYITHGYYFYVAGHVPYGKEPEAIDRKLLDLYGVRKSRWQRARRKLLGRANVHYLRFDTFFILIANHGRHEFFEREGSAIRDVRREPIAFAGYSIGCSLGVDRRLHASVRIHPNEYRWLKRYMTEYAPHSSVDEMETEFRRLRFEPYAPVVRQLYTILRAVNKVRKTAGRDPIDPSVIRARRSIVRPFESIKQDAAA